MILKLEDIPLSYLPEFKGGTKELAANMFFDGTNRILKGRLVPGASIGLHTHEDSCEVIFVVSGQGQLLEPEHGHKEVRAGDCLYCPKGYSHSLINPEDSDEDLVFLAVVAAQA
jgi:quercetin dioxygenase-like cupin family protein